MFSVMCGLPSVHSDVFDGFDLHKSCITVAFREALYWLDVVFVFTFIEGFYVCLFGICKKNTSAVCGKVCVWKSSRVVASSVETSLFCIICQLRLVHIAEEKQHN